MINFYQTKILVEKNLIFILTFVCFYVKLRGAEEGWFFKIFIKNIIIIKLIL
jgi:hypothetical protein